MAIIKSNHYSPTTSALWNSNADWGSFASVGSQIRIRFRNSNNSSLSIQNYGGSSVFLIANQWSPVYTTTSLTTHVPIQLRAVSLVYYQTYQFDLDIEINGVIVVTNTHIWAVGPVPLVDQRNNSNYSLNTTVTVSNAMRLETTVDPSYIISATSQGDGIYEYGSSPVYTSTITDIGNNYIEARVITGGQYSTVYSNKISIFVNTGDFLFLNSERTINITTIPDPATYTPPPPPTLEVPEVGGIIRKYHYNDLFTITNAVIGPNEDGYGLQDFFMSPVADELVKVHHFNLLRIDLVDIAYKHITSSTSVLTDIATLTTATDLVYYDLINQAGTVAEYVYDNRFTCHENNYFRDPLTGVSTNTTGGTSSRTIEWGVTENYIEHIVKATWPTRLLARYFFNCGGYFNWTPYHSNDGLSGIDSLWANFIQNIQSSLASSPLTYKRDDFINQTPGSTVMLYPEGSTRTSPDPTYDNGDTLSIEVRVTKSVDEELLTFNIQFINSDNTLLVVTPSVGYWNEII